MRKQIILLEQSLNSENSTTLVEKQHENENIGQNKLKVLCLPLYSNIQTKQSTWLLANTYRKTCVIHKTKNNMV